MGTGTKARIGLITAICMIGAACGGGSGDGDPDAVDVNAGEADAAAEVDASDEATPAATEAAMEEPVATDPPPSDPPTTEPPTSTTTATAVSVEPVSFDLTTLPDLIVQADEATRDPAIAPLSMAQQVIGFPFEIPVPEGSTLYGFDAGLRWADEDGRTYEFGYNAIGPDGVVPDIDITLDGNGPGSQEIIDTWDPIMAELGFERDNSTASDPGDPGGPNSVNHVYTTATPEIVVNGVPGALSPLFIWSDEDLTGGSYSDSREILGGYRIDFELDTAVDAGIPIPIVNALLEQLPLPDGLELTDAGVELRNRSADSFDADKGLNYFDVEIHWEAQADMLDSVIAFYSDPAALFTDETTLMAGADDFFNEGTFELTELTDYGADSKRLELLLLQRYEALLGIDASSDGTEPMKLSFGIEINLVAPVLQSPAG